MNTTSADSFRTERLVAGVYRRHGNGRSVTVERMRFFDGDGWIAQADWSRASVSDPHNTLREAIEESDRMLGGCK